MEDAHLFAAVRYILLNPVRAGLVGHPHEWPHSSARAHLEGTHDALVNRAPLDQHIEDWASFLAPTGSNDEFQPIRSHTSTGRPLGTVTFVEQLEQRLGRTLQRRPPGPTPRHER
jgi:putative transposase